MEPSTRFTRSRDGTLIAYAVAGSGPPLVKTANWMTHLEFDRESPVWRHWLAALSRDHTLVRYDERGCGLSDREVEDLSFSTWVEDLEAVVDAAGLDRFPLFGMSQGGPVALAYAARHPERVTRLVLYGSYVVGWKHRASPAFRRREEALKSLMSDGWGRDNPAFRQVFTSLFIPDGSPDQYRWFNELQRRTTSPHIAVRLEEEFGDIDVRPVLDRVRCPTLVLHARRDEVIPFEAGRALAAALPDARFVALDGANHVLLEDEPAWGRFLEEVRAFLGVPEDGAAGEAAFLDRLTPREAEVLEHLAAGWSNPDIARALGIKTKTVKNHVTRIFAKLGVGTRPRAVVRAREAGLGRSVGRPEGGAGA
ncbi:MAG TPA: alpha/beta fold hydrolase [Gemmatimonadota bacterium]|nr:alpha/beta fold hydrolase [Gemmatimonadota bacterium]